MRQRPLYLRPKRGGNEPDGEEQESPSRRARCKLPYTFETIVSHFFIGLGLALCPPTSIFASGNNAKWKASEG